MSDRKCRVTVTMDADVAERLRQMAQGADRSRAWLISELRRVAVRAAGGPLREQTGWAGQGSRSAPAGEAR